MRLNRFIAIATGLSRRAADSAISEGRVVVNGEIGKLGHEVKSTDTITLDGRLLSIDSQSLTIVLNKPVGYVCSRHGQGSKTIYDLLPKEYRQLKPVGRLDKDSSGLLLLTNDGRLAHQLTHPRFQKEKIYEIELDKPLTPEDKVQIEKGVLLADGVSALKLAASKPGSAYRLMPNAYRWRVTLTEGRNRQIRRTFAALGYHVTRLHRTKFGPHKLDRLASGSYVKL